MLILVFCFAFQAIDAFVFDFGSGLYWNVENGVLVIGGEGSMQSEVPWVDYKDSITGVTIKEDVTDISSEAFSNCPNLKNVQIESNVKVIGSGAFKNCPELEEIRIPEQVSQISKGAFYGCTGLKSVTFEGADNLSTVENSAFYNCSSLTKISLPSTVRTLGDYAFCNCSSLTEINITESMYSIGMMAFRGCTSLTRFIDQGSYEYYVKDGMLINKETDDGIGAYLEVCAAGLTGELTLPESVYGISQFAFEASPGITKINIPAKTEDIISMAFLGLDQAELVVDTENPKYSSYDGAIYDKDMTKLLFCAGGKNGSVTIPYGVKETCEYSCMKSGLTSISFPDSLTTIGDNKYFFK